MLLSLGMYALVFLWREGKKGEVGNLPLVGNNGGMLIKRGHLSPCPSPQERGIWFDAFMKLYCF